MKCLACGHEFDTNEVRHSVGPLVLEVQCYGYDPKMRGGEKTRVSEIAGNVPGALCYACVQDFPREAAVMLQLALKERWRK